ncbi:MAG: hypothetical protein ABL961_07890 [Vicinamibacterales bacterium]
MIDYTGRLSSLMADIVARVPALSFIDMTDVLVFARVGRAGRAGPVATCHSLSMPVSDPGYYFWRDRVSDRITRRSEWFVAKSPTVTIGNRRKRYLISFSLPRFCEQTLRRTRKERFYRGTTDGWMAKLDTVVHELYHIDPEHNGIRRLDRADGTCSSNAHSPQFLAQVAKMASHYLDSCPDPSVYDFLMQDFDTLRSTYGGVIGTCFSPFPSFPQRFLERLEVQPPIDHALVGVEVEPWRPDVRRTAFTDDHLHVRQFLHTSSRRYDTASGERRVRAA